MERIQGLKEYVQTEHYLEGIGIGKEEQKEIQITYQPLAQGEYNINYWFVHPLTGKKLVLRVNTGSQMHLERISCIGASGRFRTDASAGFCRWK